MEKSNYYNKDYSPVENAIVSELEGVDIEQLIKENELLKKQVSEQQERDKAIFRALGKFCACVLQDMDNAFREGYKNYLNNMGDREG